MAGRGRTKFGSVVQVPLPDGRFGYGVVLEEPLVAFVDHHDAGRNVDVRAIGTIARAFRIWVHKVPLSRGLWPVVGHIEPTAEDRAPVTFFKKDPLKGTFSLVVAGQATPATLEQCQGVERAAVWEAQHVVDRLVDHFAGRPNRWVEALRAR
jgi:hypothetical protein